VAEPADVAYDVLPDEPVILMPQVPVAPVPDVEGAPTVLYEIVIGKLPLNVAPEAAPEPVLFMVSAAEVLADTVDQAKADPVHPKYVPVTVGAGAKDVVSKAD
jgi:hypothetical protein